MRSSTERQAEIDRRVAQELKNNHDFICTTNQWLQKLDTALEQLKKEVGNHTAKVGSQLKQQDIFIENIEEKAKNDQRNCNKDLTEYRSQITFCLNFVQSHLKKSDERFSSLEECKAALMDLKSRVVSLAQEIHRIEQLVRTEILRVSQETTSKVEKSKQEILNSPSEIPGLKKFIQDKLDVFDVNYAGLVREIEILKKGEFVTSKYIEDIYSRFKKIEGIS